MTPDPIKQCIRCGESKLESKFKKKKGKITGWCRTCQGKATHTSRLRKAARLGISLPALRRLTPLQAMSQLTGRLRGKCRRANLPFDLDSPYLIELVEKQRNRCAITGRPLVWKGTQGDEFLSDRASIDRIKGPLGYVKGNVRFITYQANSARGPWTDDDLLSFCEDVLATLGNE